MAEQYVGLNPGGGVVEGSFIEDLFLETGEDTYENHIVKSGQTLKVGSVVGMITASQKLVLLDNAAGDGSEKPFAVLVHGVNTTAGDDEISVLVKSTRRLNGRALVFGGTATMVTMREALSLRGISIRTPGYSG